MIILSFDTSSKLLSAALKSNNSVVEHFVSGSFNHLENLTVEIKSVLSTAKVKMEDIDLIVCSEGPGSFTGLRIGIAAAKGLSLALNKPFVTVPTLDMIAYGLEFFEGTVVPLLDARKQRFYASLYQKGERKADYLDISPDKLVTMCNNCGGRILLTGPDASTFFDLIKKTDDTPFGTNKNYIVNPDYERGYARALLYVGEEIYKRNGPSPEDAGPLYLRKSEAEIGITR